MALMEATLSQIYGDQECINRFYYQSSGTPAAASLSFLLTRGLGAVASAGIYPTGKLMKLIAAIQAASVSFSVLTVKNMYSTTDFYSLPFIEPLVGAAGGEGMAPNVAYGFRTNRVRSDIRRGTKRFTGVSETNVANEGLLASGFVSGAGAAVAVGMGAVITELDEGNTITFTPVVLGKQRYDPDTHLPSSTGRAYRQYPTESEQLSHLAAGVIWDIYSDTRTQTSRTRGRGR